MAEIGRVNHHNFLIIMIVCISNRQGKDKFVRKLLGAQEINYTQYMIENLYLNMARSLSKRYGTPFLA